MNITILPFASVKDALGFASKKITVNSGATAGDVAAALAEEHSALAPLIETLLLAVNSAYVSSDEPLNDGDELALFPPVSGG